METIILFVLMGAMNLLAFLIGARIAQKAQKGEEIKVPVLNPIKVYEEYTEQKENSKERNIAVQNLENISNYAGDGVGQKDIVD